MVDIMPATELHITSMLVLRAAMRNEQGYPPTVQEQDALMRFWRANLNSSHHCWLAWDIPASRIVGMVCLTEQSVLPIGHNQSGMQAVLEGLYVVPEYRKQGIARRLNRLALDWCREASIGRVYAYANPASQALLSEVGFSRVRRASQEVECKLA